jgi:hypothetical protein
MLNKAKFSGKKESKPALAFNTKIPDFKIVRKNLIYS